MKNFIQAFAFTAVAATTIVADTYQYCYEVPDVDRWMYPYNATPGTRIVGLPSPATDQVWMTAMGGRFSAG